ncbi:MAG: PAS domain S-box protein [Sedimentisphaerales bacterium]|nr:PAS domain S-box protein [Sedimentisphaerales bacterium]
MIALHKMTIRKKMTLIMMLTSMIAVFLAGVIFIIFSYYTHQRASVRDLTGLAEVLGRNCQVALSFDIPEDAEKMLSALEARPSVVYACIYRKNHEVFAVYNPGRSQTDSLPPKVPEAGGYFFREGFLDIFQTVYMGKSEIGTVYLRDDMRDIQRAMQDDLLTLLVVILVVMASTFLLAAALQRLISRPILSLARTAGKVTDEKDYSVRAVKQSQDEVGYLIDAFNEMLSQIQQRDNNLQESEERFRSLVEASSDWIWQVDKDSVYTYSSPKIKDILGYEPEEILGKMPFDLMPSDEAQCIRECLKEAVDSHKPIVGLVHINLHKNGRPVVLETNAVPFFNENNTLLGYQGINRDITERKRAEQEREKLIKELEDQNAELERFTYTVSHDLKSPLITIKGFLGLIEQDIADQDQEQALKDMKTISKAVDTMHNLLNEMLELSRIGRLVNPPEEISLSDLAREVVDLFGAQLSESNIKVKIMDDLPVVYGDKPRLFEVIQNLMENAIKYLGDQPEPAIEIGMRHEGDEEIIYVKDNGMGIDPKYHERVFGLFNQLDPSHEGTGVGLAIVKRIIEVHEGKIWVESEGPGRGSIFCFSLPRKKAVAVH